MILFRSRKQLLLQLLAVAILCFPPLCSAFIVTRMQTSSGIIDVQLYENAAPLTVDNFLSYVKSGAYKNTLIHRSVPGFVIQGGGFFWDNSASKIYSVITNPPVTNEFSSDRSNIRGTIAMAKLGNDPNSATSQWFFNLSDNSANLDAQNGGFTVFGKVLHNGMSVADTIAALPTVNGGGAFSSLPLATPIVTDLQMSNLVLIKQVSILEPTKTNNSDRIFAYLEGLNPDQYAPANALTANNHVSKLSRGYYYRYYATSKRYLATLNGKVYQGKNLNSASLKPIGTLAKLLPQAAKLGY